MAKDPCNTCVPSTAECESLPSALDNFIDSFYGQLEKQVVDGRVVWIPPCDLNEGLPGYPRADGEGLACYFLRLMGEIGVSALSVASIESAADYVQPLPNQTVAVVVTNPQLLAVGCYVWSPDGGWYRVESISGTSVVLRVLFEPPHSAEFGTEIDAPSKFLPVGPLTAWDEAIEAAQTESEAFAASAAASAENSAKSFATSADSVLSNNLQTFANSAANSALASANAYTDAKDSATRTYVDDQDAATLAAAEAYADSVVGTGFTTGRGLVQVGSTIHFAQSGPFPVGAIPFASGSSAVGFSGLFWSSPNEQINFLQNSPGRPSGLILSNGFDAGRVSLHQVSQDAQHLALGAVFDGADYVAAGTNAAVLRRASDVFEFAFDDGLTNEATFTPTVRMRFDAGTGLFEFLEAVDFNGVVGVQDDADNTKRLEFDIATVATGQTRVLTMGNRNVSLVPGATFAEAGAVGSSFLTMSTARLLGRGTAGTGAIEEIEIGTGLDLTSGVLSTTAQPIFDADGNLVFTGGGAADELENGIVFVTSTPETGTVPAGEGYLWFDGTDLVLRVGTTNTVLGGGGGSVFDGNGNFLIGGATAPATMEDGIAWLLGVAPTANVENQISMWVQDRDAGQASLVVRGETGVGNLFGNHVGFGTLTPAAQLELAASGAAQFRITNLNLSTIPSYSATGFSPALGVDTAGYVSPLGSSLGGLFFNGFSTTGDSRALGFIGHSGLATPTSNPIVSFWAYKHNGSTNRTAPTGTDICFGFQDGANTMLRGYGNRAWSIHNGTAPSASVVDAVLLYSADRVAGEAGLHLRSESGRIYSFTNRCGLGTASPNHQLTVSGNVDVLGTIMCLNSDSAVPSGMTFGLVLQSDGGASGTVASGKIAIWFDGTDLRARIGTTDYTFTKT